MTREERHIEYDERIDRYLRNQMSDSERADFERDVDNDQELRERLVATSMLVQGIAQEGMRREGQAQLDAIKQMSRDEFESAARSKKGRRSALTFMKWASGIAAAVIAAYGLYTYYPTSTKPQPEMAKVTKEKPAKSVKAPKVAEPTLASLADEYNKPFGGEPDGFVEIREQIRNSGTEDMMAVVYDIDKVEMPSFADEGKGAENAEVIQEMNDRYADCARWYKALAYLKANDKDSAIRELKKLIDHGQVDELKARATDLLNRLEK